MPTLEAVAAGDDQALLGDADCTPACLAPWMIPTAMLSAMPYAPWMPPLRGVLREQLLRVLGRRRLIPVRVLDGDDLVLRELLHVRLERRHAIGHVVLAGGAGERDHVARLVARLRHALDEVLRGEPAERWVVGARFGGDELRSCGRLASDSAEDRDARRLRPDVGRHDRGCARGHRDDQVGLVRDQAVHVLRVDRGIEDRGEDGHACALLLEPALDRVRPGGAEGVLVRADDHADVLAVERALLAARAQRAGDEDGRGDGERRERNPTRCLAPHAITSFPSND